MKISAMRRARPLLSIDRAISIATITSHTDGSAKPPSTSRIGVPLAAIAVNPRRTSAEAGSGSITIPAMTQAKIAARRQPCGVTASGRGTMKAMTRKRTSSAARPRTRTCMGVGAVDDIWADYTGGASGRGCYRQPCASTKTPTR